MLLEREILVLQCSAGLKLLENIAPNWTLIKSQCLEAASQYLMHSQASIGIIDCSGAEQPDAKLENWLDSYKGVFWIAILSKQQLAKKEWRLFIATHCYDYHTIPILKEKLFITIGRAYGMTNLKNNLNLSFQRGQVIGMHDSFKKNLLDLERYSGGGLTISGEWGVGKRLLAETWVNVKGLKYIELNAKINDDELDAYINNLELIFKECAHEKYCICISEVEFMPQKIQLYIADLVCSRSVLLNDCEFIFCCGINLNEVEEADFFSAEFLLLLKRNWMELSPLRERGHDKFILAKHYLYKISREQNKRILGFSHELQQSILDYSWPGNIAELIEKIHVGVSVCEGDYLTAELMSLDEKISPEAYTNLSLIEAREEAETLAIKRVLNLVSGRPGKAAELLGISRASLYRLITRYGIRR